MRGIKVGVLLLDGAEVIIRIYHVDHDNGFTLMFAQDRDLYTFDIRKPIMLMDVVEMFANALFQAPVKDVDVWQLVSRNVPDDFAYSLEHSIKQHIEHLSLREEQELICQGVLFTRVMEALS
jgi:hypothetical protein